MFEAAPYFDMASTEREIRLQKVHSDRVAYVEHVTVLLREFRVVLPYAEKVVLFELQFLLRRREPIEHAVRCLAGESAFAEQGVPLLLQQGEPIEGSFLFLPRYTLLAEQDVLFL